MFNLNSNKEGSQNNIKIIDIFKDFFLLSYSIQCWTVCREIITHAQLKCNLAMCVQTLKI